MEMSEPSRAEDRLLASALRAYERGRARWALGMAVPVLVLPLASWLLGGHPVLMCVLGGALFAIAALLLWRGEAWGRGVGLGLAAGLIPFGLVHVARCSSYICTESMCFSICLAACVIGGVAAGVIVTSAVRRTSWSMPVLAATTGVAFLTGALGCGCVGKWGLVALAAGLGASIVGGQLLARVRRLPPGASP
jgi:hypothetical protein